MNSKKSCLCCGGRLTANNRRPVTGKSVRLFVVTRLFPLELPNNGYICNKCRSMYNKWKVLPEFYEILKTIDDDHQTTSTTTDDISSEDEYMDGENGSSSEAVSDEHMDDENGSDQLQNETSSGNESIDEVAADSPSIDEVRRPEGNIEVVNSVPHNS